MDDSRSLILRSKVIHLLNVNKSLLTWSFILQFYVSNENAQKAYYSVPPYLDQNSTKSELKKNIERGL